MFTQRLSLMTYTITKAEEFNLVRMLDFAKELELDGIDICFAENFGKPFKELRGILDGYGIPVVCNTFTNNVNDEGMTEDKWMDNLKKGFEDAVVLGAPAVMMPTPGLQCLPRAENRKKWIGALAKGVEIAGDYGVHLTVENFPGEYSPFVVADDLLEAVRNAPGLKITYDSGNAAAGEDPAESFRRCAEHVVHAHFKDWNISNEPAEGYRRMLDGRYYRRALIGEGDIDHASCLRALDECGYSGCVNIEYEGDDYDPYDATRKAVEYLRAI